MSIDTTGLVSHGGQPAWLQRHKIMRAKNRNKLIRFIRCKIGWHNPPYNRFFEEYGSVMVGGPCTRCNDETYEQVAWIGDVWDFPSAIRVDKSRGGSATTVFGESLEDEVNRHVEALLA